MSFQSPRDEKAGLRDARISTIVIPGVGWVPPGSLDSESAEGLFELRRIQTLLLGQGFIPNADSLPLPDGRF